MLYPIELRVQQRGHVVEKMILTYRIPVDKPARSRVSARPGQRRNPLKVVVITEIAHLDRARLGVFAIVIHPFSSLPRCKRPSNGQPPPFFCRAVGGPDDVHRLEIVGRAGFMGLSSQEAFDEMPLGCGVTVDIHVIFGR